jgi:hypothetical protein
MRFGIILISAACVRLASADPLLDRVTVTASFPMPATNNLDLASGSVSCPDETVLLTGGAALLADNNGIPPSVALVSSGPLGNGWTANAREMVDVPGFPLGRNLILTAVCGYTHASFNHHLTIVTASTPLDRSTTYPEIASATASCPANFTLISGGASVEGVDGLVPLGAILMASQPSGNAWYGLVREVGEIGNSQASVVVKAICADVSVPVTNVSATAALPDDPTYPDVGFASVSCPSGSQRLGGGAGILSSNNGIPPQVTLMTSEPTGANGWSAVARETQSITRAPLSVNVTANARCLASSAVTGLEVVTRTVSLANNPVLLDWTSGSVQCPSGKTILGGGARILASNNGTPPYVGLVTSLPEGNGWTGVIRETTDNDPSPLTVNMTVSAVCAVLP